MFSGAISAVLWGIATLAGIVGVALVVLAMVDRTAEAAQRDR